MPKIEGLDISLINNRNVLNNFNYVYSHNSRMRRSKIRSKAEFAIELKNMKKNNKELLNYSRLRESGRNDILYEAVKLFGGWRNACIYSGIRPLTKTWTKENVISGIKKISSSLNKSPTREDLEKIGCYNLMRAAERRFGNWNSALIACNLTPNKKYWSKKQAVIEMRNIAKTLKHTPSMNELRKLNRYDLLNAINKLYPSYNNFISQIGLPTVLEMNKWSKSKIIKEIIFFKNMLGRTPTRSEIEEMGRLDLKMATLRHFGSWNNAIVSAGITPNLDAIKNDFGKRWEKFVMKVIKKKYKGGVEFYRRLPNKTIPDSFITRCSKIVEIKSNASDSSVYDSIKNYLDFCKKLEFWYLYGTPPKVKNNKVIFKGPEHLRKIISELKDVKLSREFYSLKEEVLGRWKNPCKK